MLTVEGVVSPAWIEHADGSREPLAVGAPVENGERIETGPGSRVLLRMGEGSAVKLGEDARFAAERLQRESRGGSSLWSGSLDVLRGAFRYSTALVAGVRAERDLTIRVNTLVAGIRGTDVWGKAELARDVVVLIEGRITVKRAGQDVALVEPRSLVAAPRAGGAPPVTRISLDELRGLAEQTEMLAGAGGARLGGRSRVVVITSVDETYARSLHARLRESGYPAQLRMLEAEGSPLYQVFLGQLGGEREARTLAQRLRALGYEDARPAR